MSIEQKHWKIVGGYITTQDSANKEGIVSAQEYWESRVDDFTGQLKLSIEGFGSLKMIVNSEDLILKLIVETQNHQYDISDLSLLPIDHVVCDERWIPLHKPETDLLRSEVDSNSLKFGNKIGLNDYLKLVSIMNNALVRIEIQGDFDFSQDYSEQTLLESRLALHPYPYQKAGISWLREMRAHEIGAILGDEMGLGKTVQILGAVDNELQSTKNPKILIIVPSSLKLNWLSEFAKFLPFIEPYVHVGSQRLRLASQIDEFEVVLTTYPILNRDYELLGLIKWTVIICDEAHVMKNPDSVTRKSLKQLGKVPKILSTGTPIENNLLDLWSLTDLVKPEIMGNLKQMKALMENQFAGAIRIGELVKPLIMRRLVKNVQPDLPELVEMTHWIEPSAEFVDAYREIRSTASPKTNSSQFALITKLRQFCTYPPMVGDYLKDVADSKVNLLLDLLDSISLQGEKAIIFTSWHDSADFICNVLKQVYPNAFTEVIDGREVADDRFPRILEFQAFSGFATLVCNTRAAGEGLNIVAANHIIHFDRQWNPAKEAQATARSHRIGQHNTVFVHKLVYQGTIEEVIDDRLMLKAHLAEATLTPAVLEEDDKSILEALRIQPTYTDNGA